MHDGMGDPESARPGDGEPVKYLSFRLAGEEYAVPILAVREILGMVDVTALPGVPRAVKGVINLRGSILPVVDLRLSLGMAEVAYGAETCLVVLEVPAPDGQVMAVACIVDTVCEVCQIAAARIGPAPRGARVDRECVAGLARHGGKVIILLDPERVLAPVAAV